MKFTNTNTTKEYKPYSQKDIFKINPLNEKSSSLSESINIVSKVIPFRANNYIINELIDWSDIPNDPIFQLTFPQRRMLEWRDYERIERAVKKQIPENDIKKLSRSIQERMNPHPAGQLELNVPEVSGKSMQGMQHKYDETVLFFPKQGQTCHAYCTYCFRWPQFSGLDDIKFASNKIDHLILYLKKNKNVTDVLITGGDPLFMSSKVLRRYIEPLIKEKPGNISTIRLGTKSLAYWPYRFLTDKDSDDLLSLFDEIVQSGLHLAFMAHFSHHRELETEAAQRAIKRILQTGATIRCQSPIIRHINDDPDIWSELWQQQVKLGAIPYYMFIGRNTGPKSYFKVGLKDAYDIFTKAYKRVSGLARTVRGPSMSATPGKIIIDGIAEMNNEKVFVLKFIQGRDASWVNKVFFARYDEKASWLNDLKPASGASHFFYEKQLNALKEEKSIFENAS